MGMQSIESYDGWNERKMFAIKQIQWSAKKWFILNDDSEKESEEETATENNWLIWFRDIYWPLSHRGNLEKWTNFIAQINWMRRQSEVNQHRSCLRRFEILLIKNRFDSGRMNGRKAFLPPIRNWLSELRDGRIILGNARPFKKIGHSRCTRGVAGGSRRKSLNNWKFVRKLCYDLSAG